jgi:predicted amino acid dehydrogenase
MQSVTPAEPCLGKYAFLIHPTSAEDLHDSAPHGFKALGETEWDNWVEWISSWSERHYGPGVAYHLPVLRSKAGGFAEGWLIAVPLTPTQLMKLRPRDKAALLAECAETAKDLGADIMGLGAFTSIISRGGTDLKNCGLHITTGNSLTAMAASESLCQLTEQAAGDFNKCSLGVIGAAGSVGQLATRRLASRFGHLTLFGNPNNPGSLRKMAAVAGRIYRDAMARMAEARDSKLDGVARKLQEIVDSPQEMMALEPDDGALFDCVDLLAKQLGTEPPVKISNDLSMLLPKMRFVLSVTSQGAAFIDSSMLAPGAIVCDASRPADVKADVMRTRPDVFVYEGGLMHLPEKVSFGRRNIIGCESGINLSCLSETITLAMSGMRRSYSIGNDLPLDEAEAVYAQALHHGFRVHTPDLRPATKG